LEKIFTSVQLPTYHFNVSSFETYLALLTKKLKKLEILVLFSVNK